VPRLDSCLFAVWLADAGDLLLLGERVRRLAAFYGRDARVEAVCDGHVMVGGIGHDHGPLAWGGPIPEGEEPLDGLAAIFDVDADSVRVSCASGGVTSLYEAASARIRAWSTHAVAAAWLARGEARVDPGRIPELLTWGFVGGRRTLIDGALAVPAATQIDLRAAREPEVSCFLPPGRRWAQLPEEVAYEHAERALLESLERRLRGARDVYLGLTGGLDSCVVAVALKELGIEVTAFTWGQAPVGDMAAAARVADVLGIPHRREPGHTREDHEALAAIQLDVRWTDGCAPVRFIEPTFPEGLDAVVFGAGGETGRAFYYTREVATAIPEPSRADLERVFDATARLAGARRSVRARVRARGYEWLDGADGWRALDVAYGEQRVRRWGRSMVPPIGGYVVAAFATPEVQRALASMPLADRVTDGFHRRFLTRVPELVPPPPAPAPQRSRLRAAASLPGARRGMHALRRMRRPAHGAPWPAAGEWADRPHMRAWLEEEVLGSPLLAQALGRGWLARTGRAFSRDEARATELVLLAAAPVALESALEGLADPIAATAPTHVVVINPEAGPIGTRIPGLKDPTRIWSAT
jgi:hypothetical protein